jgi:hypothetical protein
MAKTRSSGSKSTKVGRSAESGKFSPAERVTKVSPLTQMAIKNTSRRYSKALKSLANK